MFFFIIYCLLLHLLFVIYYLLTVSAERVKTNLKVGAAEHTLSDISKITEDTRFCVN